MEKKRTHRLAIKNSVGEWRTIGHIVADDDAKTVINELIATNRLSIVLSDEVDFNYLLKLQLSDGKGNTKLNNWPGIFDLDQKATQKTIVQQQPTVMKQKADDLAPF